MSAAGLRGTHRYAAPQLTMRGRRRRKANRAGSPWAESSSRPAQLGPFVLGHAPCVLLDICPYAPRVPGRLPDGLSGDGCPDVTAPHPVDLRVRQLRFPTGTLISFSQSVASRSTMSRCIGGCSGSRRC